MLRMGTLSELLTLAHERAETFGLPYQGALTPAETRQVMQLAPAPSWSMCARAPSSTGLGACPARSRSSGRAILRCRRTPTSSPS